MLLHIIIVFEPIAIYLLRFNLVIFSLFFLITFLSLLTRRITCVWECGAGSC